MVMIEDSLWLWRNLKTYQIKRVYYIYDTAEGVTRGYHAYISLEQILICIHGSCKIRLDNGKESCSVRKAI